MTRPALAVALLSILVAGTASAQPLPAPKPAFAEAEAHPSRAEFLRRIVVVNNTGKPLAVWIRATLLDSTQRVEVPSRTQGRTAVACPYDHPWSDYFETIRISVWDGDSSDFYDIRYKGGASERRFSVTLGGNGKVVISEK